MKPQSNDALKNTARSVDAVEIERFAALAEEWWDPHGAFRPLHKLNPARLEYLRDGICRHFGRDSHAPRPLSGLTFVDIGCGGGLIAEPMARLGAKVTGIDATEKNVGVAALHARQMGLEIDYRFAAAEELAAEGKRFDVVLNLEVIEHVADVDAFLTACRQLIKPDGVMVFSTLNRTAKAFALAIIGAEYVMRWLPPGTHDWQKFLKPSELSAAMRDSGFMVADLAGLAYSPISDAWRVTRDVSVNYLGLARPI